MAAAMNATMNAATAEVVRAVEQGGGEGERREGVSPRAFELGLGYLWTNLLLTIHASLAVGVRVVVAAVPAFLTITIRIAAVVTVMTVAAAPWRRRGASSTEPSTAVGTAAARSSPIGRVRARFALLSHPFTSSIGRPISPPTAARVPSGWRARASARVDTLRRLRC